MHTANLVWTIAGLTGTLLALVGFAVWLVRPSEPLNRAFGAFAITFGGATAILNFLDPLSHPTAAWALPVATLSAVALAISAIAVFIVALRTPAPLTPQEHGLAAAALALIVLLLVVDGALVAFLPGYFRPPEYALVAHTYRIGLFTFLTTLWGALLLLGLRYRSAQNVAERRDIVLMTAALAVYPAGQSVAFFRGALDEASILLAAAGIVFLLPLMGTAFMWIVNATLPGRERTGRNLAWLLLGAGLAQAASMMVVGTERNWGSTAGRVVLVGVLAYAVLRHQILGIDLKVRRGLSKSTIAAAFIAAFFVASEGAQIFFGSGNEWVGLLAAGALVFAIAPLQRAAERLAERAVPVATPEARLGSARGAESYRRAVRLALRDRRLTPDEEVALASVAHDLGLTAPEATRIRLEVEREASAGGETSSPS